VKEPDNLSDTGGPFPLSADLPPTFARRTRADGAPLSWGGADSPQNNSNGGGQECPPYIRALEMLAVAGCIDPSLRSG
jgi:hypothetical protein